MTEVSFGEWLKRRRGAIGWTQKHLALQLNCSTSALRKFESEERRPSPEIVERLAEIFHIPREERKAFLRYARGDWQAISNSDQNEAPWREKQIEGVSPRNNLPLQLTSFIGREKEQVEIVDLLTKHRLVALVGTGGIGKTRLSLEVAQDVLNTFPDGLWFIELAPLSDPALVPQAIVNTLGLIDQANRPPQIVLTDFLKTRKSLLILDNCEHLIPACAQLAEALLLSCLDLKILATSREALGVSGEFIHNVATLSIPDIQQAISIESLTEYESVRLFHERAQEALPGFIITPENASAILQVCHHLDGIPLALELAAARLKMLRVEEIAARLTDRFRLLSSGPRTAIPRHQTLQALIDWSHDLLPKNERTLLRRLSIFAGGWSLEAAESVCAGDGIERHEILDLLTQLVNKSLVLVERRQGQETRYHMLETIRQYAHEKLWAAGEGDLIRQRHLTYFVDLAERAEPNLRAFGMIEWLDRLEIELDNIRIALEWAQESDVEAQLRIASSLLWFWHIRGHRNEGIDWLERGLAIEAKERGDQPLAPSRAMIRGKALNASGTNLIMFFDYGKASLRLEESLAMFQRLGEAGKQGLAYAFLRLGQLPSNSSLRFSEFGSLHENLALFRELGDKFGVAESLMQLASYALKDENYEQAATYVEEELALSKEIGDQDGIATALWNLGDLAFFAKGDYRQAIALIEESLSLFRSVDNKWAQGLVYSELGDISFWQGNYEQAMKIYEGSLVLAQKIGDRFLIKFSLYNQGFIAWLQGDYINATQKITDSLSEFRNIGYDWLTGSSIHALGDIALAQGNDKDAAHWYERELASSREIEMYATQAFAYCGLGKVAWVRNNNELAVQRFDESLKISQKANFKYGKLHALYGLGRVALSMGNYTSAYGYFEKMLELQRLRLSPLYRWNWLKTYGYAIAYPLDGFAILAAAQNQLQRTARLLATAENLYSPLQFEMSAKERAEHEQAIAAARAALGEEAFTAAWEEGKKMTLDEAIAYALKEN